MEWLIDQLMSWAEPHGGIAKYYVFYTGFLVLAGAAVINACRLTYLFRLRRWRVGIALAALLPFAGITAFFKLPEYIAFQKLYIIIFTVILAAGICLYLFKVPSAERKKLDKAVKSKNPVERYQELQDVDIKKLTPKETILYRKWLRINYCELGSINKAHEINESLKDTSSAYYYMFRAVVEENAGNLKEAHQLLDRALAAYDERKDGHYLKVMLRNNYGRSYRILGNFQEALLQYKEAKKELRFPEEKDMARNVYANYIFTQSMLHASWEEIERSLEEYRRKLDSNSAEDMITCENIYISAAKQAGRAELWRERVTEGFDRIMSMKLPDENRLIFEATSLRVAHTGNVNFFPELEAIRKDLSGFLTLDMPARYYTIKEIHILFRPETAYSSIAGAYYDKVRDFSVEYMAKRAKDDLEEYLHALPADAVHEKCAIEREIVGSSRYREGYSLEDCIKRMLSVRDTYERNGLVIDAAKTSLFLADEHLYLPNLDTQLMPRHRRSLDEALDYIDKALANMYRHPDCADIFIQAAWIYIRIHEYKKSRYYTKQFEKCELNGTHYTPIVQRTAFLSGLITKLLEYEEIIKKIQKDSSYMQELSVPARRWLASYPNNISSLEIAILWGRLLGCEPLFLKTKVWFKRNSATGMIENIEHTWLCIQEFYDPTGRFSSTILEIDMAFDRLEEPGVRKMAFLANNHPLEKGCSVMLRKDQEETNLAGLEIRQQICPFSTIRFEDNRHTIIEEIGRFVADHKE